jgi:acyl-CoA synthetase (AMP-forming)/AMP-acid ligase II/acyl carrier protein
MRPNDEMDTVRDLIDRMAETQPDLPFLLSPETGCVLTFKGLQGQARQLCRRFQSMGLAHGDKIAFLMDNALFTAQLLLGAMYGGGVTVPLNARAGTTQLSYSLEHCDANIVFVGRPYDALIKDVLVHVRRPVEVVYVDSDTGLSESEIPAISTAMDPLSADDAALLMYTSGSTGQPKGVLHTHRSILARARNSVQQQRLTAADRSLLVLPLYHSNAESVTLTPTLLSGGSVVVAQGFVIGKFWRWLIDYQCSWSAIVPTMVSQLLDWKDDRAASQGAAIQHIRFLRSSSGALSPSLHRAFIDKFKVPLLQGMGAAEAGNVFLNPTPPGKNKIGSLGLVTGFETRFVDREGTDLPMGETGEMLLRGDGMMQGYYKDPAGTQAALDSEGWFHTGDLAYRDEESYVFMIGRSKELIIKGGVNIAPKQIDEVLESHPAILEAAAVGVPDRHVGEDVVAFAVLRDGVSCDERELLSFCERHLGYFKTPTRIHFVSDLPKGPSGKVQRLRLTETAEGFAATAAQPVAMSEGGHGSGDFLPVEQIITEIWLDLLVQPHIDPDSNFFALGGQSLQAIQCLSRLRERTPVLLSLSDFFENATVAQLATLVRRQLRDLAAQESASGVQRRVDLQPIPVRDFTLPCPLSPAQERIWFMEYLKAGEPVYNEAEAVRLKGKLDLAELERAFNVVVGRHESLRTTIEVRHGQPVTIVHDKWPLHFKRFSLRHLAASQREAALAQLLIDEPRRPYQLEAEPGVRVTVAEIDDEDHAFILMMHHIFCDRSSFGILWRELATLYDASVRGQHCSLPPLPIQYGDYAVWLRQSFQQARFDEDLAFWREKLRGAPTLLDQPVDRPRPSVMSFRGNKQKFEFDSTLVRKLRQLCREQQASLFTAFAAALSAVMHRYTGQDDILIGIPIADRERPELQPLIGFLVDIHILRADLSGAPTFRELMARVQKGLVGVYLHRSAPFDQVVAAVQPERNPSYSPFFQVLLNWRDRDDQAHFIGLAGLACEALLAQPKIAKFDLTLVLTDEGNTISLEAEYSTDLFDKDRIERLAGHLQTLLEGAAADAEQRLAELPLLTSAERHELLFGWGADQADEEIYS